MSYSLWSHGLQPARLLCPWDIPGKNTAVGCHFLLQWIFLVQGLNPSLLHLQVGSLPSGPSGTPNYLLNKTGNLRGQRDLTAWCTIHVQAVNTSFTFHRSLVTFVLCGIPLAFGNRENGSWPWRTCLQSLPMDYSKPRSPLFRLSQAQACSVNFPGSFPRPPWPQLLATLPRTLQTDWPCWWPGRRCSAFSSPFPASQ